MRSVGQNLATAQSRDAFVMLHAEDRIYSEAVAAENVRGGKANGVCRRSEMG